MRRLLLAVLLVATACAVLALPAVAFPPNARTDFPTEVTDTGATLNGIAYPNGDSSPVTYHFEYGPTRAFGKQTPEAQAPPFTPSSQPKVSQRVALPGGSTFFFRIVATNSAGEKGVGETIEWKTPGATPPTAGTTRTTDTVGAGGGVSTGSNPSKSNPIVVSVKAEKGGKLTVDEIPNPERPGADPDATPNPEDDGPKDKNWYGPAIQVFPPAGPASDDPDSAPRQLITVVIRLDSSTDLIDANEWNYILGQENPRLVNPNNRSCLHEAAIRPTRGSLGSERTVQGGDTVITIKFACASDSPFVLHFYNPGWGVRGGESFGTFESDLRGVLDRGSIHFGLHCTLRCSRDVTATISRKSAKKLGLKSNVLGTVHTDRGENYDREIPLSAKVRKALKRITRRGGQITVSFKAKAVGPGGQVFKKGHSTKLKAESNEDAF